MRKADVRDIESLEVYYNKVRKIRFSTDVQVQSLDDVYNNLFPYIVGDRRTQKPTFYMRGGHHCHIHRHRSIDDFIKLCKSYFPDLTLKNIFEFLKMKQEAYDASGYRQHLSYCPHIRKYNFKGLTSSRYALSIEDYNLHDLNSNLPAMRVREILI